VRVTWGGVYVHSAPWSVGSQGNSNVSHGCINLGPDNAAWYYDTVHIGDPIIVQQ
jgi:lipoprotein-anchoring transpeptidase ErfK/SrfK